MIETAIVQADEDLKEVKSAAFTARDLRGEADCLSYILVVGGKGDFPEKYRSNLKEAGYFDEIFLKKELGTFESYIRSKLEQKSENVWR